MTLTEIKTNPENFVLSRSERRGATKQQMTASTIAKAFQNIATGRPSGFACPTDELETQTNKVLQTVRKLADSAHIEIDL